MLPCLLANPSPTSSSESPRRGKRAIEIWNLPLQRWSPEWTEFSGAPPSAYVREPTLPAAGSPASIPRPPSIMQHGSHFARPRMTRSSFRFSGRRAGIRVSYLRCSRTGETRGLAGIPQGRSLVAGTFQLRARAAEIRAFQVPDGLFEEPIQFCVASGLIKRIGPLDVHPWIAISVR